MKDSDDVINVPAQVNAANQLPPNLVLLKMENENMMAAAAVRPRDPAKIIGQLVAMIDAFPKSADDAIYSKPVGKVKRIECGECPESYEVTANKSSFQCPKCGSKKRPKSIGRDVMKFAEGLSIRAAETVRSIYGYTRLATTTEILEDGCARITGMFVDYAAGNITSDERIVSNYYTSYQGEKTFIQQDRFLSLNVKAEKSKLRRDIILDSVPNEVKAAYVDACEKKLAEMVTPEKVQNEILPWFAERGLSLEHLEKMIGRPLAMGWTQEDRLQLKKVAAALKNEEITVAELIRDIEGRDAQPGSKVADSDLADKLKKKSEGEKPEGDAPPAGNANNDVQQPPAGDQSAAPDETILKYESRIEEADGVAMFDKLSDDLLADKTLSTEQRDGLMASLNKKRKPKAKAGTQRELGG